MEVLRQLYLADRFVADEIVPSLYKKKIGIFGSNGFLGRHWIYFLDILNETHDLGLSIYGYDLDSSRPYKSGNSFHYERLDVSDSFELGENFDYLIHAASIASPSMYRKFPLETFRANVMGTENVLKAALSGQANRVMLLSTSEIYGNPDAENIPTTETYAGNVSYAGPRACYDESKRGMETLNWIYANYFKVNTLTVRPFNVYGPGQSIDDGRIFPDLLKAISSQSNFVLFSDGNPTRTFCFVSDFIIGSIAAMIHGRAGEGYNIGNKSPEISISDLINLVNSILEELGRDSIRVVREVSRDPNYLVHNPLRRCPDISKATMDTRWTPRVEIKNGIKLTLEWLLENQVSR